MPGGEYEPHAATTRPIARPMAIRPRFDFRDVTISSPPLHPVMARTDNTWPNRANSIRMAGPVSSTDEVVPPDNIGWTDDSGRGPCYPGQKMAGWRPPARLTHVATRHL